jgi:steroid 5-alpha reductase family enzyme
MAERSRTASVATPIGAVIIGALVAWAGSQGGVSVAGIPVFALAVGLAFLVQWLVFIPSYLAKTERYYDLTGSLTYISVTTLAVLLSEATDARSLLLFALVLIWATRLGAFLFRRVRRAGKDDRFDEIKQSALRFFTTWTIQGLWVSLTFAAALAAITSAERKDLDALAFVGLAVWIVGFAFEATADLQKNRFRADPANKGAFISTGLWSVSRHPNYFGEIVLWIGVAIIALPVLQGWQFVTLISPVFVFLLITRVSGVPLLEKKADKTWGGQEAYEAYKKRTPVLVPVIGRKKA